MQKLFLPAIALLNRMGYTKKFTLLWAVSLIAIAVVVKSLYANLNHIIQPSQQELQGLALIGPISRTVQVIQQHRGISAALLGGNEAMKDRRADKERDVAAAFKAMEEALPPDLVSNENLRHIKEDWEQLRKEGLHWTVDENFTAHTRLADQLLLFEVLVADDYLLTLDPELASSYLIDTAVIKLPHVLEHLGQLRAYGTGILAKKRISEPQKVELKVMVEELGSTLKFLNINLDKSGRYNPAVQKSLVAVSDSIAGSARQVTGVVASDILTGRFATPPDVFLEMATAEIDKGYVQIQEALLPTAKSLIERRIAQAKNSLLITANTALLLFLLVVYISVSIYYAIVSNIKSLVHSAHTFANGDFNQRVKLNTRDEISQIGDSFNRMADGFIAMLDAQKQAEGALRKSKDLLQSVIENAPVQIFWKNRDSRYLGCNTNFAKGAGYLAPDEVVGKTDFEMGWKEYAESYRTDDKAVMESGIPKLDYEEPFTTPDGGLAWARTSKVPLCDESNQVIGILGIYEDITERKQVEQALIESREKFHDVIETALDAVVQIDASGIIIGWTRQAENIFGWSHKEAVGQALSETIIPLQYREAHVHGLKRFLLTGEGPILNSRIEITGLHRDGHEFPIELAVVPIRTAGKYEFSAFIRDITKKKESDDLIWKQANFDLLTGLPNRHMFHDRLVQEAKKADRAGLKIALLFIDLDKFKEVNDTLGHNMGDILLVEAARRIGDCVRETDTVARLGGDEFTVILAELDDSSNIERITENILRKLTEPFHLMDEVAYVSASIGITLYPSDTTDIEGLLKNADQAMYTAKDQGRNRFSYFTQTMQQAAQARLRLVNELRGALAANQFRIFYQPVVELATGRINKAEALIRWQHPKLGLISPAQFIPLAEETGLIVEIGNWIFKESARQLKHWIEVHNTEIQVSVNMSPVQHPNLQVSVNVSPVQFHSTPYKIWSAYLQELELPEQSMVIEITEGLLLDTDDNVTGNLLEFHDVGIQVAIDDFGTGYSSLSYLKKFDIDYLKIDQSFVRNLATDPDDLALSEAIIVMAHKLDLKVIAEGVETEAQCKLLHAAGCDYAQGYLFSKPLPAEEFEELLKSGRPINLKHCCQ